LLESVNRDFAQDHNALLAHLVCHC